MECMFIIIALHYLPVILSIYDQDFILGGYLAPYLQEKDLSYIHEEIRRMTPFSENQDFLHISKMPKHNITIGAALPYIQKFLNM